MSITVKSTQIKETMYLRIPKNIAELMDVKGTTKFLLRIKQNEKHHILEYEIQ